MSSLVMLFKCGVIAKVRDLYFLSGKLYQVIQIQINHTKKKALNILAPGGSGAYDCALKSVTTILAATSLVEELQKFASEPYSMPLHSGCPWQREQRYRIFARTTLAASSVYPPYHSHTHTHQEGSVGLPAPTILTSSTIHR